MKSSRCFCLLLVLLAYLLPSSGRAALPETIREVKPSVVGIGTLLKTRRPPAVLKGTGFVVADGRYVITNSHVLTRRGDLQDREAQVIFIGSGKKVKSRQVELIADDPVHDLALLKIKSGGSLKALELGQNRLLQEGEPVAFTGYPIGAILGLYPVTHRGIVSAITPIAIPVDDTRNLSIAMLKRLREPYEVFQLDAIAYPGNSGSPVYHPSTGEVVAVLNSVFVKTTKESAITDPSGISYAIPVRYVRDLLREAGVKP